MSRRLARSTPIVALALAFAVALACVTFLVLGPVFALVVLVAVGVAGALVGGVVRRRPERTVLLLGVVVLGFGLVGTTVHVVDAAGDHRVESRGHLDAGLIRRQASPGAASSTARLERRGIGYLSEADGTTRSYRVTDGRVALWAVGEYAPWALAVLVFVLAVPLLRAAERGDPFFPGAAARLALLGTLLLFGVPLVRVVQWFAAEVSSTSDSVGPVAEPFLSIGPADLVPGVLVLVLAGIFRRGIELRELERQTV